MKRDMELIRQILFKIEEDFEPGSGWMSGLNIVGYDMQIIAEHCSLLHQQGFVRSYKAQYAEEKIYFFGVGPLTAQGYDFLDKIRSDDIWEKTNKEIKEKKLPRTVESITKIAGIFIGNIINEMNS